MSDKTNNLITTNKKKYFQIVFHFFFVFNKINKAIKMFKMEIKIEEIDKIKNIYLHDNPKIII